MKYPMKYRENDIAYIVENNLCVTKVRIIRTADGRCTVSIGEGKAPRLPEGRLYKTQEEAEKHVYRSVKVEHPKEVIAGDPHQWEYINYR